ncbi:MAG: thiamine diphosphokinase [Lachnospiraceae bacterium]|nr:thiamine diphosphokinase [Lachnospiraceae bacterium]
MTAILVCGGTLSAAFLREVTEKLKDAAVYAVDGGLTVCHEAGIVPEYLVGDFDTVSGSLVAQYEKKCKTLRHQPEKDATDTELAIDAALEAGTKELILLGATGSRMDHTMANVHMLHHVLLKGGCAALVDEHNRITLHDTSFTRKTSELFGNYISFLPFFGEVEGVTLTGMKYPLKGHTLTAGNSLGISNEAVAEQIEVSFTKGYLLMIEARD